MKFETIDIEMGRGVAVVWLNRPEVRNAFNETMIAELGEAFEELERDEAVRALVLAGRGPVFCAGADLHWMKKAAGYSERENLREAMALAGMLHRLHTLKKPTVARVHGAAYAGGMGLLAACDIAVATQDTEFCLSEVRLGLSPATISPYVIAAMGERAARRYFLTAEPFTAADAYRTGLVQEITVPEQLDGAVNELLGHLVQGGPHALTAAKELIRAVARQPLTPALVAETAARIAAIRASDEGREGVRAFLEKRKPAWLAAARKKAPAKRAAKAASGKA